MEWLARMSADIGPMSGRESEAGFQVAVINMAMYSGWKVYHTYDSRRSVPGYPDLTLVRDRILFRELKLDKGRLTVDQEEWIERLNAAGGDAGVWRPADWDAIERELTSDPRLRR